MATPQEQFFEAYRNGLETLVAFAGAMLGEAERLRVRQLEATRKAMQEHADLGMRISSATTLDELMSAQAKFANQQFEIALGFWSRQLEAASHGQREVLRRLEEQGSRINGEMNKMLEALPAGAEPMTQATRSLLLQAGYAALGAGAQFSEQAARLAEAQIATASAGVREAAVQASQKTA